MRRPFAYRQWNPCERLQDAVETLWYSQTDVHRIFVVPPDGRRDVIWRFERHAGLSDLRPPEAFVTEVTRSPLRNSAQAGQLWIGARLRPGVKPHRGGLPPLPLSQPLASAPLGALSDLFVTWLDAQVFDTPPAYIRQATLKAHLTGGRSTVRDLCEGAGVTSRYLLRGFTRHIGVGPKEYLAIMRLNRALQLRSQSSMNLTQVALECGFSDQAHFSRSCRRLLGMPPKAISDQIILPRLPLM